MKKRIDPYSISCASTRALGSFRHYVQLGETLANDPDLSKRLQNAECPVCFYVSGRIGGAAITDSECGICGKEMSFGNTCVDVLCKDCARKHGLCKHCGGDVEMKQRRSSTIQKIMTAVQP